MVFARPFSPLFWACYLCAGLSDILDGIVARGLKQQSDLGARLDSVADLAFACAIAAVTLANFTLPAWLWVCGACVALTRVAGYIVGYRKYHAFSALHTCANKAAGGLVFLFPLLYRLLGLEAGGALVCAAAFVSALEELLITISAGRLDRERRSLFAASRGRCASRPADRA